MTMWRTLTCALLAVCVCLADGSRASAQGATQEELDVTRLDVERLPPEAIEIDRDMYARGLFVEGALGVRGVAGGGGRYFDPGPLLMLTTGYELTRWFAVAVSVELSLHGTNAPAPPTPTTLQLFGASAEARLQGNFSPRVAMWLAAEAGVLSVSGNFLTTYGVENADELGAMFGGKLGVDWHFRNRHHSIGLSGGGRLYPTLRGADGEAAIGVHVTAYVRYVF